MNTLCADSTLHKVVRSFNIAGAEIQPFGNGLINRTWKVCTASENYILQKVNDQVFRHPKDIARNISLISDYFKKTHPDYFFIAPVPTVNGEVLIQLPEEGWFRMMPFAENSFTFDVVSTADQAYEAAKQFGKFTRRLSGFDANQLKITIPHFHNLALRYDQFLEVLVKGEKKRIHESQKIISELLSWSNIVDDYRKIVSYPEFRKRVTHHDTKISNVLFDENDKAICVIDLDTVMPGFFMSDVGDMMRTYLSPVSEEETDFEKIIIRKEFFDAIIDGYGEMMADELSSVEKQHFLYAGKFMIYMQALRFLTDYLNNDVYYGAKYEGHNLTRANNQLILLRQLVALDNKRM